MVRKILEVVEKIEDGRKAGVFEYLKGVYLGKPKEKTTSLSEIVRLSEKCLNESLSVEGLSQSAIEETLTFFEEFLVKQPNSQTTVSIHMVRHLKQSLFNHFLKCTTKK